MSTHPSFVVPPYSPPAGAPEFGSPPAVELAVAMAFQPVPELSPARLGLLWREHFSDEFERLEEQPPVEPVVERFGEAPKEMTPTVEIVTTPPRSRLWFMNKDGTELVQVQDNWLARNWRKLDTDVEYPHYERVRESFGECLMHVVDWITTEEIGELVPTQGEVTYVNHIPVNDEWSHHGEVSKVLSVLSQEHQASLDWESVRFAGQLPIPRSGDKIGRLTINAQPAFKRADGLPILSLTLTARSTLLESGLAAVFSFLDMGHDAIIRTFVRITTEVMQRRYWGRRT